MFGGFLVFVWGVLCCFFLREGWFVGNICCCISVAENRMNKEEHSFWSGDTGLFSQNN